MENDYRPTGTACYCSSFWCIKRGGEPEIYVMADRLEVDSTGALLCIGGFRSEAGPAKDPFTVLLIAPGNWTAAYAASCWDGSAVAVEAWEGEVVR